MAGPSRSLRNPRAPAERVRARLARVAGPRVAGEMPPGYQRLGRVLLLRLPRSLDAYRSEIGRAWQRELGVETVLAVTGPIEGEYREPRVVPLVGTETETEVIEHGVHWRLDAARLMFAQGNRAERRRAGELVSPGETVVDLFAGIGYFAIPAACAGAARVLAVEKNPLAVRYLRENVERNGVVSRVEVFSGDNRTVPLPPAVADRVFLGYLPSALPWIPRALELARDRGAWFHVHLVADSRRACEGAVGAVQAALARAGASLVEAAVAHEVKPYGPGRTHVVVDAWVLPPERPGPPAPVTRTAPSRQDLSAETAAEDRELSARIASGKAFANLSISPGGFENESRTNR